MKNYVIFMDLDGTLLTDDKKICRENYLARKKLNELGATLVIATGRSPASVKSIEPKIGLLEFEGYYITFNGVTILDKKSTGIKKKNYNYKPIFNYITTPKTGNKIMNFVKKYKDIEVGYYADSILHINRDSQRLKEYSKTVQLTAKIVESVYNLRVDFNKIICVGDRDKLLKIQEDFTKVKDLLYTDAIFSSKNMLEFNPCFINKGSAAKKILSRPEFKYKDNYVIAIGDAENDIPMFEIADLAIAVKGSSEKVINAAHVVSEKTNNEGILDEVIEKYIQ